MPFLWRWAKNHEKIEKKVWECLSKEWKFRRQKPVYEFSFGVFWAVYQKEKWIPWQMCENKRVRCSMLQQLLGKNNVVLPQSLGEPECLAKKFNASFVKKIETVLVSIPLTNCLKLNNSHKTTWTLFRFLHWAIWNYFNQKFRTVRHRIMQ